VFGSFASQMFFLAGIGILRVLWLPLLDVSPRLMKLGDIAYLPYMIRVYSFSRIGYDTRLLTAYACVGVGIMIFIVGTFTWLQGKYNDIDVIDFWIFGYSRYPQYLGFIIWSYGVMLVATRYPVPRGGVNPDPSLPWLISALLIICVSIKEEIVMMGSHSESYNEYKSRTPFMLPLPRFIQNLAIAPYKIIVNKGITEKGVVLLLFILYFVILVLLSLPFYLLDYLPGLGWMTWPY